MTRWVMVAVVALILANVGFELVTGESKDRHGMSYVRLDQPRKYWAMVALKVMLAALIGVAALRAPSFLP